jgi:hypothetical protein
MGKKTGFGSGITIPDHISESLETIFWVKILKFFKADPESGIQDDKIRSRIHNTGYLIILTFTCTRLRSLKKVVQSCPDLQNLKVKDPHHWLYKIISFFLEVSSKADCLTHGSGFV